MSMDHYIVLPSSYWKIMWCVGSWEGSQVPWCLTGRGKAGIEVSRVKTQDWWEKASNRLHWLMGRYETLFFTEKPESRVSCWAGGKQIFAVRIDAACCQKSCHSNLCKGNTNCYRLTGNKSEKLGKKIFLKKGKSKIKQYNNKTLSSPFPEILQTLSKILFSL